MIGRLGLVRVVATVLAGALAGGALPPSPAEAQQRDAVRVFLDCQTHGCDSDEFRTQIGFVDWVRERTAADVHVIATSQDSGAGQVFTFDFLGQGEFDGVELSLQADLPSTLTRDEELERLTRTLKAGLVPYVARRGYAQQLDIRSVEAGAEVAARPVDDPWNQWVFSLGASMEASGEEQQNSYEFGASATANRVTPLWKINARLNGEFLQREVELSEGTFDYRTDEWELDVLAVRSLSRHWSAGGEAEASRSTRINRDAGGRVAAALEWNYYPYAESNRRQFLVHYQVGFSVVDYEQVTIFDRTQEELFDHRLAVVYQNRQPWGDVTVGGNWRNYLHDFGKNSLSAGAEADIRLFRGFELYVSGSYERVGDQLYLSAEGLTDEEILVGRRELATAYEYEVDVGLNYRFGSIYNNVVNNRFPWILWGF